MNMLSEIHKNCTFFNLETVTWRWYYRKSNEVIEIKIIYILGSRNLLNMLILATKFWVGIGDHVRGSMVHLIENLKISFQHLVYKVFMERAYPLGSRTAMMFIEIRIRIRITFIKLFALTLCSVTINLAREKKKQVLWKLGIIKLTIWNEKSWTVFGTNRMKCAKYWQRNVKMFTV